LTDMLARMDKQRRGMNMAADPRWNALEDSLRHDLTRMSGMSATELKASMPAHHERMARLMKMHQEMMRQMR
ncbi:MAG TPA: hypothetical protein VFU47_01975, partial [Armatimonadota bacterium]|nr:hypothetical protein [Armatimonadota bacterium]